MLDGTTTRRPFSSTSDSTPAGSLSASRTAASTSSGLCVLSSTISCGVRCTPILTSTAGSPIARYTTSLGRPGGALRPGRCAVGETVSAAHQREVGDAPPDQALHQPDRVLLRQRP